MIYSYYFYNFSQIISFYNFLLVFIEAGGCGSRGVMGFLGEFTLPKLKVQYI